MNSELQARLPRHWKPAAPEPGWHRAPHLSAAFQHCRRVTRHHARSFYFCSFLLPPAKRKAAYAIYAFCRHIDDVIDESMDCGTGTQELPAPTREILRSDLETLERGESPLPFAPAFMETTRQFGIERQLYLDLIEGCCRDREPVGIRTFDELEDYCYYVAGVVGLMMSKVFGLNEASAVPQAVEMGIAMQLTNILRDIHEDFRMGRIYLPSEEWPEWGVTRQHIAEQRNDDAWKHYLRMQIKRARGYYQRAARGLVLLEPDGSRQTATLMARIYGGILDEIENADYDIFSRRVHVPFSRKVAHALRLSLGR